MKAHAILISEALAAGASLLCTLLLGIGLWRQLDEFGPGLLLFIMPVVVSGLLLLWRYWSDVRRCLPGFLAGLLSVPVLLALASVGKAASRASDLSLLGFAIYLATALCCWPLYQWSSRHIRSLLLRLALFKKPLT